MNDPLTKDGVVFELGMSLWQRCITVDDETGVEMEFDPCEIKTKGKGLLFRPASGKKKETEDRHFLANRDGSHYTTAIQDLYSTKEAAYAIHLKELECELDAVRLRLGKTTLTPRVALADLIQTAESVLHGFDPASETYAVLEKSIVQGIKALA